MADSPIRRSGLMGTGLYQAGLSVSINQNKPDIDRMLSPRNKKTRCQGSRT